MGWFRDDAPHCEGYVRGLTRRDDGELIELGYPGLGYHGPDSATVAEIQVECACGWRSPRMPAPLSAQWFPFTVSLDERDRETCATMWTAHVEALAGADPHTPLYRRR